MLADYERYVEGLITREEYEERRKALHEKVVQREKELESDKKDNFEDARSEKEKEVFGSDSKLTYEIVDHYVKRIIVNGAEDINIEWKDRR